MKPSRFRQQRPLGKGGQRSVRRALSAPQGDTRGHAVGWIAPPESQLLPAGTVDRWSGDEGSWLQRARHAWQVGDWRALAALGERPLHRHPERARLALLAAAGCFQLGDEAAVRRLVALALAWGCNKELVARVLISGLHNTLGRAASILDQPARALTQFAAAILTASPAGSVRTITQSRAGEQLAQLGLSVWAPDQGAPAATPTGPAPEAPFAEPAPPMPGS